MRLAAALTLLISLPGCAGSDLLLFPDFGFSDPVLAAMRAAAADWEAHVPVTVTLAAGPCPPILSRGDVCLHPVSSLPDLPWQPGDITGLTYYPDMWLKEPALEAESPERQQRLIAHELGHAMGLFHSGPGTLMYPHYPGGSLVVTAADVEQWRVVHTVLDAIEP